MVSRRRLLLGSAAALGLAGLGACSMPGHSPHTTVGRAGPGEPPTATTDVSSTPTTDVSTAPSVDGMPLPDGTVVPVTYRSRQDWGAPEEWRNWPAGPEEWHTYDGLTEYLKLRYTRRPVQAITVHHTAGRTPTTAADSLDEVLYIYRLDAIQREWGDMGYNLLIDPQGVVYEGRSNGFLNGRRTSPWPIFGPPGEELLMTTGAHILDYNTGNIGICVIGDFHPGTPLTRPGPTPAQRAALVTVIAALVQYGGIDPLGMVDYVNIVPVPDEDDPTQAKEPLRNVGLRVHTISGHRDWATTTCPGDSLYSMLPQLRADVAATRRA